MWIWNVIQYLSRASFSIQFPNWAPVVIYTDCGAVNFITRTKILWVTKLKYLWFIGRRLLDTFANIQGAIISKGKYFSDKNSFWLSFRLVRAHSGQSGTTEFDWADNIGDWCLWGYCHLSGPHTRSARPLCVQCQVSIILSQECKLFQSSVLTMFNSQVSCLVESDGRVQYWQQVICGDWAEHSASMTLISADMRWLARDHTSQTDCSDHTQHCQWYLQQSVDWGLQFCKQSRVLHEVCIPGLLVLQGTGRYSGGVWTGTDWEYRKRVSRVTH